MRYITAQFLIEVCPNVGLEPQLQPLSGKTFQRKTSSTSDQARLDIQAQNFWDNSNQITFFDVRVFNAHAPSNSNCLSINACYRKHELEKRRIYEQRINEVDHGTFTSLVFSSSGGWIHAATMALKRL